MEGDHKVSDGVWCKVGGGDNLGIGRRTAAFTDKRDQRKGRVCRCTAGGGWRPASTLEQHPREKGSSPSLLLLQALSLTQGTQGRVYYLLTTHFLFFGRNE